MTTHQLQQVLDLATRAHQLARELEQEPTHNPNTLGRESANFQGKFDELDGLMTRISAAQAQAVLDVATLKATFPNVA